MGKHSRSSADADSTAAAPRAAGYVPATSAVAYASSVQADRSAAGGNGGGGRPRRGDKGEKPKRRGRGRRVLSTIFLVVGIALLAVAGYLYFHAQSEYSHQRQNNQKLEKIADVKTDKSTGAPTIDFAALEAVNNDIVGWIDVEGTTINFPVYQGKNNTQYLRHSATGEYSIGGQVFMDCQNTKPGMVDAQTLIYGHHLNDGQMFAPLDDLKKQANFDKITTVWYVDRNNKAYEMEPLLLYIIKSDYDDDLRTFNFASTDEFHTYLNKMLAKASAKRSDAAQIIQGTSHVMTLVTCNYDFGHGRAVLLCVPKSEAAAATGQSSGSSS